MLRQKRSDPADTRPAGPRDGTADLVKGIAVILMIQVHVTEQFATTDVYESILGRVSLFLGGPACAPAFLAVMGYFLSTSRKGPLEHLKRGLLLFAGGIALNTARSASLLLDFPGTGEPANPWFFILGADILTLAGLGIIILVPLKRLFRNQFLPYLILAIVIVLATPFLSDSNHAKGASAYLNAFFRGYAEWSYFPVLPWMAYVLTGYSFGLLKERKTWFNRPEPEKLLFISVPAWILLALTLSWASGITANLSGPGGYYHHGILFFAWSITFLAAWSITVYRIDRQFESNRLLILLKWTGRRVTSIYVIQWLIIGNLAAFIYRSQGLFQLIFWFSGVVIATLLLGYLYEKARSGLCLLK